MIITTMTVLIILKLLGAIGLSWAWIISIPFLYVGIYLTVVVVGATLIEVAGKYRGDK